LGLCSNGNVKGIPPGNYTNSIKNKKYAVVAVNFLKRNPSLAHVSASSLWQKVIKSLSIRILKHNGQMNIVLDLWNNGYII